MKCILKTFFCRVMSYYDQFTLLIWKNYVLQKRRPVATIFELLLPVLFSVILFIIRDNVSVTNHSSITTWREFRVDHLPSFPSDLLPANYELAIAYIPGDVPLVAEVMAVVEKRLNTNISKSPLEIKCNIDVKKVLAGERDIDPFTVPDYLSDFIPVSPYLNDQDDTAEILSLLTGDDSLSNSSTLDNNNSLPANVSLNGSTSTTSFSSVTDPGSIISSQSSSYTQKNTTVSDNSPMSNTSSFSGAGSFVSSELPSSVGYVTQTTAVLTMIQSYTPTRTIPVSSYDSHFPPRDSVLSAEEQYRDIAKNVYAQLSEAVQKAVDKLAMTKNASSISLLVKAFVDDTIEEFLEEVARVQWEDTLKCIANETGYSDFFDEDGADTNISSDIIKEFREQYLFSVISITPTVKLIPFENEEMFMHYMRNGTHLKDTLAGVIFGGVTKDHGLLHDNLKLTFRFRSNPVTTSSIASRIFSGIADTWQTSRLFPDFQVPGPRSEDSDTGGRPYYYNEGFLALLHAVHMGIAETLVNVSNESYSLGLKRYPYPPYIDDDFILAIRKTLPFVIMLSFSYTSLLIVRSIVQEKESRMKEYMVMMGLSNWLHWLAWFIKYLLFLCISCTVMATFYKLETSSGSILTHSSISVIFILLVLFAAATVSLSFLISVFFKKASVAAAAGGIIYATTYMPYIFMSSNFNDLTIAEKIISSLLSNVAMASGFNLIGMFEGKGTGIHWYNIYKGVTVNDNLTLLDVFAMLLADTVIYMVLALYLEEVWPGEYGIPKPWNFPFSKSYWMGVKTVRPRKDVFINDNENSNAANSCYVSFEKKYFEEEPTDLKRTVEIKGLRKVYENGNKVHVAVHYLDLNMYDGQIMVLLGHNGAGKTTTMSILTGFFPPTDGEVLINGQSITKELSGVCKDLGLCPQYNILFDLLTVDEHLYFFGRLKGLTKDEALGESKKMEEVLELTDKASAKSNTLSGGMKRKLSVGIALCAGSKYVILDEPTSGMDPSARRSLWEVLQNYKSRCSMLLSTHFMDEADVLGDRIAIMAKGKLRCVGSSGFLKGKFGVGYHIVLTKQRNCEVDEVTKLMQSFIPLTILERTSGAELSYALPFYASPQFPLLFKALDNRAASLGISGYGAVVTTLEEVFLRVTENDSESLEAISQRLLESKSSVMFMDALESAAVTDDALNLLREESESYYPSIQALPVGRSSLDNDTLNERKCVPSEHVHFHISHQLNKGTTLWFQQFRGLLVKRILHSRRNYKIDVAQLIVPVFFTLVALLNVKYPPWERPNVPLDLTLDAYEENNVHVSNAENLPFGQIYIDQFKGTKEKYILHNDDLETFLSDRQMKEGGEFNSRNLVSATFVRNGSHTHAVAWFNNQAFHTPASSLAYMDQAYLRNVTNRNFKMKYINYPLPRYTLNRIDEQLKGSLSGFLISFNIVLGFSFLAASFSPFVVKERMERSALLQTLSGVEPFCFWLSAFTWDFFNFLIPSAMTLVLFAIFDIAEYTAHASIALLLFVVYCWAAIPLTYLLSLSFTVSSTALVRITALNTISGLASIITINILRLLSYDDTADVFNRFFLILPTYCLGMGLADLYVNDKMVKICTTNAILEEICKTLGISFQINSLAWERYGVGKFVFFLFVQGLVFFATLFWINMDACLRFGKAQGLKESDSQAAREEFAVEDDDVTWEYERITNSNLQELIATDHLIIKELRKVYRSSQDKIVAVRKLCLGVTEGECFGLLGINGAGKTTTFRILTGDLSPTSGTAYVYGYDITKDLRKASILRHKIRACG